MGNRKTDWLHLLTHGYPMPEDALYVTYYTDQDIFSQGVVWSYMSARPEVGAIASVNRFRREMRLDSGDIADAMARIAVSSHYTVWRRLLSRATIERVTGGPKLPNPPTCVLYSDNTARGPLQAPDLLFHPQSAALYAEVDPEDVFRFVHAEHRRFRARPVEHPAAAAEYGKEIEAALARPLPPAEVLRLGAQPAAAPRPGLRRRVFEGAWEKPPDFTGLAPASTRAVESVGLGDETPAGACGLSFEGWIKIPETGEYGIWFTARGAGRLRIGDWELVSESPDKVRRRAGVRRLEAGFYPFRLDFAKGAEAPSLKISVSTPGTFTDHIPPEWLFHDREQ